MADESQRIRDELMALRCKRGEEGAFGELVQLWEKRLFYYVRRLVPTEEDAWDVLQDVWVRVFRNLPLLRQPSRLAMWLYSIAHRTALSHLRSAYSRKEVPAEQPLPESVEDVAFDPITEDAARVHEALERLSQPFREMLTLHFLQAFSVEEISQITGIPTGTVKSRLFHARQALRKHFERTTLL